MANLPLLPQLLLPVLTRQKGTIKLCGGEVGGRRDGDDGDSGSVCEWMAG